MRCSLKSRSSSPVATKAMTLTVRPAGSPKIPLAMSLAVDMNRTISLPISGTTPLPVPMVTASRLLAPMIVRKTYKSDINGATYTASDVPVPVGAAPSIEGLTSPVNVTFNGSVTLPTTTGSYAVVATLDDPIYSGSATGNLLITDAGTLVRTRVEEISVMGRIAQGVTVIKLGPGEKVVGVDRIACLPDGEPENGQEEGEEPAGEAGESDS